MIIIIIIMIIIITIIIIMMMMIIIPTTYQPTSHVDEVLDGQTGPRSCKYEINKVQFLAFRVGFIKTKVLLKLSVKTLQCDKRS